jgi:hypothetical protein
MLRAACFSLVLLLPCAQALAQNFSGTYTTKNPQGGSVTLTLKQDAQSRVSGTLSGNGNTFQIQGQAQPTGILGTVTGDNTTLFLHAQMNGAELRVILAEADANGQPNLQATREIVMARAGSGGGHASKPAPSANQETQLSQFLTRNAWCSFSYNQRSGTSTKERVMFRADGTVTQQGGAETYSSGYSGTVAGQHTSGNQGRWRVQGTSLELSQDGMNWAPQPLQVTQNSNGYPILKSGGKEYMVCQ